MQAICMFLPESDESFARLPQTVADYWEWQANATGLFPYWGRYHWVLQTYLYLKDAGLPVQIVQHLPSQGVIVTHFDCVDYGFRPSRDQTLVIMLVDREVAHPHAHLHVTHNPVQRLPYGMSHAYMPPWPQIGLIPRDPSRGDRFERVGYFGDALNLDPTLSEGSFRERVSALGLELCVPAPGRWHDFSSMDAIIALRKAGRDNAFLNKPSLKLFNAWLAGVPAILGHESAYRHAGRPGVGYIEATSADDLIRGLEKLQHEPATRQGIVRFGRQAVTDFEPARTVERWSRLIRDTIDPLHEAQTSSRVRRAAHALQGSVLERILWRRPGHFLTHSMQPLGS